MKLSNPNVQTYWVIVSSSCITMLGHILHAKLKYCFESSSWKIVTPDSTAQKLASSDYFFFRKLNYYLSRNRFSSKSDVNPAKNFLNEQGCNFYKVGLNKFVLRSNKCLNRLGDYVKKWSGKLCLLHNFCIFWLFLINRF